LCRKCEIKEDTGRSCRERPGQRPKLNAGCDAPVHKGAISGGSTNDVRVWVYTEGTAKTDSDLVGEDVGIIVQARLDEKCTTLTNDEYLASTHVPNGVEEGVTSKHVETGPTGCKGMQTPHAGVGSTCRIHRGKRSAYHKEESLGRTISIAYINMNGGWRHFQSTVRVDVEQGKWDIHVVRSFL